jgi:hypothetical protein
MGRLVVFSVSSFCVAFVAMAGLAAYTAAHRFDAGFGGAEPLAVIAPLHVVPRYAPPAGGGVIGRGGNGEERGWSHRVSRGKQDQ